MNEDLGILDEFKALNRKHLHEIWQYAKDNNMDHLSEEEQQIGKCMLEHEEYHNQFEIADLLKDHDFAPEKEVNPFLHITLHVIVEHQLKSREPIEVYQFYNSMRNKRVNHHDTVHLIANIFNPVIFRVFQQKESFDIEFYKRLLKKYKGKHPEKIYSSLAR